MTNDFITKTICWLWESCFLTSLVLSTIQPCLLGEKLLAMQPYPDTASRMFTGWPQYVRVDGNASEVVISKTGQPQGAGEINKKLDRTQHAVHKTVLPEETQFPQRVQQAPAHLLPVWGSQRSVLCHGVLGTGEASRLNKLCDWAGTRQPRDREEDEGQEVKPRKSK